MRGGPARRGETHPARERAGRGGNFAPARGAHLSRFSPRRSRPCRAAAESPKVPRGCGTLIPGDPLLHQYGPPQPLTTARGPPYMLGDRVPSPPPLHLDVPNCTKLDEVWLFPENYLDALCDKHSLPKHSTLFNTLLSWSLKCVSFSSWGSAAGRGGEKTSRATGLAGLG